MGLGLRVEVPSQHSHPRPCGDSPIPAALVGLGCWVEDVVV